MNESEGFQHEQTVQILWMVIRWKMKNEGNEGNNGERLNFDEDDQDNSGGTGKSCSSCYLVCNAQGLCMVKVLELCTEELVELLSEEERKDGVGRWKK